MLDRISGTIDRVTDALDRFQRSRTPLAVAHGVLKKFSDDQGSQLAKLLAYMGFFSLFPLLLASVSVLAIALRDNPDLQQRVLDSALAGVPVLGSELADTHELSGGPLVLVLSALVAFLSGLGLLEQL